MDNTNNSFTTGKDILSFNPIILVHAVLKRWLLILLVALIAGVGAYIMADSNYTPKYRTSTVFVVTSKGSSASVYSNLSSTTNVATLFSELLDSSIMRKTVMEEMGVSSLDAEISTAVTPNTNLLSMTVTSSDPRTAFLTASALIEHHEALTYTIVDGIIMEVLQYPTVPVAPINSANAMGQMKRVGVLAALAVMAILFFITVTRDVILSSKDAQKKLDCGYLGSIPHENKYKTLAAKIARKKTSILIDNPITGFQYVENIHKFRRRVEQKSGENQVLMITSLLENEGKSTISANLALSLAKKHPRVLLIDCDLRKPACHNILNHKAFSNGIKEVLEGKANIADSVIRHQNSNLYLLLAHTGNANTADLIISQRMCVLLDWARKNFDYVVLDLPPMTAAADAEAMTALADVAVLVVRQNIATASGLNKAVAALDNQHAVLLGCVLNDVYSNPLAHSGYGYGYGYGGYHKYNYYNHYGSSK